MTRPAYETFPDTAGNPEWLRARYVDDDLTLREVADLIGCTAPAARLALTKAGIPVRTLSETKVGRPSRTTWTPEMREAMAAKRRGAANPMYGRRKDRPEVEDFTPAGVYKPRHRLSRYGITVEQYEAMLAAQEGRCAICGQEEISSPGGGWPGAGSTKRAVKTGPRRLSIDHCHTTKKVRGLLCGNCNLMLGLVHDEPAILRAAADYLERC